MTPRSSSSSRRTTRRRKPHDRPPTKGRPPRHRGRRNQVASWTRLRHQVAGPSARPLYFDLGAEHPAPTVCSPLDYKSPSFPEGGRETGSKSTGRPRPAARNFLTRREAAGGPLLAHTHRPRLTISPTANARLEVGRGADELERRKLDSASRTPRAGLEAAAAVWPAAGVVDFFGRGNFHARVCRPIGTRDGL